jgi:hypothetical protein
MVDWLASYAAVLSTVVSAVQIYEWNSKRRKLLISANQHFDTSNSAIIVRISNVSSNDIRLDFVAYAIGERPWRNWWRFQSQSAVSLARLVDRDSWKTDGVIDDMILSPGDYVYGIAMKSDIMSLFEREREFCLKKFRSIDDVKFCIAIEHSLSDKEFIKNFNFDFH